MMIMGRSILVLGATGLIGGTFLNRIKVDEYFERVIVPTRRRVAWIDGFQRFEQHIVDFDNLEDHKDDIQADIVVIAFGTTTKKAGSRENFFKIDRDYPRQIAELARNNGAEKCILVSSIGAAPKAGSLYLKIKGELEQAIIQMEYPSVHILRPSLLLGPRKEFRLMEEIGKIAARPLSLLAPAKYRPIHAQTLARKIEKLSKSSDKGVHIHMGGQLVELYN